ncbi:hypothetical protein [Pyrobaculum sp.]|uniref:hypothetical protein n=1 Tax=Pyrobaculum sp. TaxID=2004705 RepID=UPI003D0FF839
MNSVIGRAGECIAEEYLKTRGFLVWRPGDFIRLLEVVLAYSVVSGECREEPKEPITLAIPTPVGYVSVTYWRGRCLSEGARTATPLEASLYAPCLKKCVEEAIDRPLLHVLSSAAAELLQYRAALRTVDLFAFRDGALYAVEVKTNSGKLTESQLEKASVLRRWLKPLVVRVYLQNPLVEIRPQ